jgi:hypothetical protein
LVGATAALAEAGGAAAEPVAAGAAVCVVAAADVAVASIATAGAAPGTGCAAPDLRRVAVPASAAATLDEAGRGDAGVCELVGEGASGSASSAGSEGATERAEDDDVARGAGAVEAAMLLPATGVCPVVAGAAA